VSEIRIFGVIGAGQMGQGIAQVAAQLSSSGAAGMEVRLLDAKLELAEKGKASIAKQLGKLVEKGKLPKDEADATLARLTPVGDYAALRDCDIVVEAATENVELKKKRATPRASRSPSSRPRPSAPSSSWACTS
jgi:3-hydroxybutyryl-CoA dehydrogenase